MIAQKLKNEHVLMAKAFPTRKAKEKYLYQTELSLPIDQFVGLVNCLKKMGTIAGIQQDHIVVCCSENYRKEKIRLVIVSNEYGGRQIVYEKCTTELPNEDMVFDDDNVVMTASGPVNVSARFPVENWEKMFGGFFLKKSDDLPAMVKVMETFLYSVAPSAILPPAPKKRKAHQVKKGNKPTKIAMTEKLEHGATYSIASPDAAAKTVDDDDDDYVYMPKKSR